MLQSRWWVVSVFYLSSTINYLDRMILATAAPAFMAEFRLTNEQYGQIQTAFYLFYMISSPLMGWFLDRLGLNLGASIAIAWYSIAGMARGFTTGVYGLVAAHAAVAIGEAAGIPSTAKAAQTYLKQEERAIGSSLSQMGLTIGALSAGFITNFCMAHWGWRSAFFVAGWLGFLWIPLWYWASKRAPLQPPAADTGKVEVRDILGKLQTWGMFTANILGMGIFSLWTGWTTIYFVKVFGLSMHDANNLYSIPQFIGYAGSFLGGFASMKLIQRGWKPLDARRRICLLAAAGMLFTAFVPLANTPMLAVAAISLSFFASSAWGVNLYTMPLDAYGSNRAAFAVSLLTAAYGMLQIFISPWIGRQVDQHGFGPVCTLVAVSPLIGYFILELTKDRGAPQVRS
jgi:MFS transporter, ACS family, hexuronate transporter